MLVIKLRLLQNRTVGFKRHDSTSSHGRRTITSSPMTVFVSIAVQFMATPHFNR